MAATRNAPLAVVLVGASDRRILPAWQSDRDEADGKRVVAVMAAASAAIGQERRGRAPSTRPKRCRGCGQFLSAFQVAAWDHRHGWYWHRRCAERLDDQRREGAPE